MDIILLNLFSFLRPILFIDIGAKVGGLSIFELAAIFLALMLFATLIYKMALKEKFYFSSIDMLILLFTLWCVAISVAYPGDAKVNDVAKLIIPLWTFTVAKNVIKSRSQFLNLILIILIGFSIPLMLSSALIITGNGLEEINYWTGIPRYKGVYENPHNMGHNMAFAIMLVVTYLSFRNTATDSKQQKLSIWIKLLFALLTLSAIFNLYNCSVRTVMLGLVIFFVVYLFFFNKKILLFGMVGILVLGILFSPLIVPRFFNDFVMVSEGKWEKDKLGSGRIGLWTNTLKGYGNLPIDKILAGNGIGNREEGLSGRNLDTHSDILGILEEAGLVGFVLYMLLQIFIFKRIYAMQDQVKYLYLAMFVAIFCMNFVSNSYISRFGMAQFFYLIMAYVDVPLRTKAIKPSSLYNQKEQNKLSLLKSRS